MKTSIQLGGAGVGENHDLEKSKEKLLFFAPGLASGTAFYAHLIHGLARDPALLGGRYSTLVTLDLPLISGYAPLISGYDVDSLRVFPTGEEIVLAIERLVMRLLGGKVELTMSCRVQWVVC